MKKLIACFQLLFAAIIILFAGCSKDKKTSSTFMTANIHGPFGLFDPTLEDPFAWNANSVSATYSTGGQLLSITGILVSTYDSSVNSIMHLTIANYALDTVTTSIGSSLHPAGETFTYYSYPISSAPPFVNSGTAGQIAITNITASGIQGTFSFNYTFAYSIPSNLIDPAGTVSGSFDAPLTVVP